MRWLSLISAPLLPSLSGPPSSRCDLTAIASRPLTTGREGDAEGRVQSDDSIIPGYFGGATDHLVGMGEGQVMRGTGRQVAKKAEDQITSRYFSQMDCLGSSPLTARGCNLHREDLGPSVYLSGVLGTRLARAMSGDSRGGGRGRGEEVEGGGA